MRVMVALLGAILAFAPLCVRADDLKVTVDSGALSGFASRDGLVRSFKGVPYAAAPVGALRWRPPQPVTAWQGTREANRFAPICPQPSPMPGAFYQREFFQAAEMQSEDCLTLNVWTAVPSGTDPRPVMVFFHSGGNALWSGSMAVFDGTSLARKGAVVVTINYRLGVLGFLAHPELDAESPNHVSGNYGLLDLVAALQWTRDNIAAFGGDPAKVTIAGESAGSEAVSALMASPLAKGLFRGAIGQSAAMFSSPSRSPAPLKAAEALGADLGAKLGAKSLADMRAAPADAVLAAAPRFGFRPIVDGHFLPAAPAEIFAAHAQSDVPLLAGWCKDEGFNFTLPSGGEGEPSYVEAMRDIFGADAEACLKHYPAGTPERDKASARALGGDLTIIHNTWRWIEAQKATGKAPLWRFRFERCPLTPQGWFGERDSRDAGAFHAGDILYVFDNLHAFPWLIDESDREIARTASGYWVNFVKQGDPNGPGLPSWPSFREPNAPILAIDAPPRLMGEPDRERQEFLADVVRRRELRGSSKSA